MIEPMDDPPTRDDNDDSVIFRGCEFADNCVDCKFYFCIYNMSDHG